MSTRTTKTSLKLGRITMQKIKHRKLLKRKTLKSKRLKLFVQHFKKWKNYSVEKQRSKHMYGTHLHGIHLSRRRSSKAAKAA